MAPTITAGSARLDRPGAAAEQSRQREAAVRLPDMAGLAALVAFFYVLVFCQGHTRLFRDSDAGWHIRSGESILNTRQLPRQDPYSFSRSGQPWMNWEWLADVAVGAVHRAAGLGGVAALYSAAVALAVWLWFRLHWRLQTNFLLACALAIPLLGTLSLHWLARPHVWGWVLLLAAVTWAEAGPRRWGLPLFAALSMLWANVHGSFVLALVVTLAYGVARWVRPWIWEMDRAQEWAAARYYFTAAGLSSLATLANPYGWDLHRHVIGYLGDRRLLASVSEFQSFNFHLDGAVQILVMLGIAAAGTVLALWRRRLDHFLLGMLLLGWSVRSARGLPLAALVLLPIAGSHLTAVWRMLEDSWEVRDNVRKRLRTGREYGERLRTLDLGMRAWLWVPVLASAVLVCTPLLAGRAGFPADQFPVAAADRLEQLAPELFDHAGRLLAPDKFGGYLIYRFQGRLKVFFDGRSDFYGGPFLEEYTRLVRLRPGWRDQMKDLGFTHALLPNEYSLVDALQREGWTVLYRDHVVTLLRWKA